MVSHEEVFEGDDLTTTFTLRFYPQYPITKLTVNGAALVEGSTYNVDYTNKTFTLSSIPDIGEAIVIVYNTDLTKTFEEISNDVIYRLATTQTEVTDFNDGSVVKIIVESIANFLAVDIQTAEGLYTKFQDVYDSAFIDTATGDDLDLLVSLVGLTRQQPTKATGEATFSRALPAAADIPISAGTVVSTTASGTTDAIRFVTTKDDVISTGNTSVIIPIEAEQAGDEGNVGATAINTFVTIVADVETVNNVNSTSGGADVETDGELRTRAKSALDVAAKATSDAITQTILNEIDEIAVCELEDQTLLEVNEVHVYNNGISNYTVTNIPMNFIKEVTGTAGGNPRTFIQGTDYQKSTNDVEFQIGGTNPDHLTNFYVDYNYDQIGGIDVYIGGIAGAVLPAGIISEADDLVDDTKAAGIAYTCTEAVAFSIAVTCTVTKITGYVSSAVQNAVVTSLTNYLNNLGIGESVKLAALYKVIMDTTGVNNVTIAVPAADVVIYGGNRAYVGVLTVNIV